MAIFNVQAGVVRTVAESFAQKFNAMKAMNVDDLGGLLKEYDIKNGIRNGLKKKFSSMVFVLVILNCEVVRSCQGQPVKLSHLVGKTLLNSSQHY